MLPNPKFLRADKQKTIHTIKRNIYTSYKGYYKRLNTSFTIGINTPNKIAEAKSNSIELLINAFMVTMFKIVCT